MPKFTAAITTAFAIGPEPFGPLEEVWKRAEAASKLSGSFTLDTPERVSIGDQPTISRTASDLTVIALYHRIILQDRITGSHHRIIITSQNHITGSYTPQETQKQPQTCCKRNEQTLSYYSSRRFKRTRTILTSHSTFSG